MPDELLAEQAVANREVMWRKTLAKMSGSILVSACNKDQIAGFSFFAHAQNFPEDQLYDAGFMPFTSDLI